jgi:hypothetical protein
LNTDKITSEKVIFDSEPLIFDTDTLISDSNKTIIANKITANKIIANTPKANKTKANKTKANKTKSNKKKYDNIDIISDKVIKFDETRRVHRIIIHYLSFYYGYLYITTNRWYFERIGYSYFDIHDNPKYKDQPLTYSFLRQKRIHNLKYYDVYEKGSNIHNSTYTLKDVLIYKKGATSEVRDIICTKIL